MPPHLLFTLLLLIAFSSLGETLYKSTDNHGNVTFSDRSPLAAESVEIITRDPLHIHRRQDSDGTPVFENFRRSKVDPARFDPAAKITPASDSGSSLTTQTKPIFEPVAILKGSLATLLHTFTPLFGVVLFGLGSTLVLKKLLNRLKGRQGEEAVASLLDGEGYQTLHDVIIEDQVGEPTQIDHLLKLNSGLLVIETKNYGGMIFGKEKEPIWTQRIGRRSYRFQNPLRQNYRHVETLRQYLPSLPIHSRVVFAGDAVFPNGQPANVLNLKDLILEVDSLQLTKINPETLEHAWQQIGSLARTDKPSRRKHLKHLQRQHGRKPGLAIGFLLMASGLFVLLFL